MARRILFLSVMLCACVSLVFAQERQITGTVTDATAGFPLPGVNIVIEGTTTGTTTGIDGNYSITANEGDVLVYSFVGYLPQSIPVGTQSVIDVALQEDTVLLEDIVVVGYGFQREEDVTGSIATIEADEARQGLVTSPDQMIQGRVAGVNITQNNGEPGAGFNIRIRGGTSISASNEPLYVIDGVPIDNTSAAPGGVGIDGSAPQARNPLNMINPSDIKSITILKDASATAIYGSRGANGVVLIETKDGEAERLTVDYEGYASASTAANELDLLSADEFRSFVEEQITAGLLSPNARDNLGNANTDWQDEILQTGVSHSHNLAFSGGTASTRYRASLNYLDQEGVVISSGLERLTGRLNADHQALSGRLRLALNLTSSYTQDDYAPYQNTGGFEGALFNNVISFNPTQPVMVDTPLGLDFFEIGEGRVSVRNPVALSEEVADFGKTTRSLGNVSAELDLVEGLTAKVNFGGDRAQGTRRTYLPRSSPVGFDFGGRAVQANRERTSYTFQSYVTYTGDLGERQNFDLLGGYEFNEFLVEEFGTEARDFVTDVLSFDALEAGASFVNSFSQKEQNRLISFFGRANYNFNERYYLTGVLRYDGSSRFGADNRWAVFPSISGAWRISDESFLAGNETLTNLRLKAGWGIVGSQEIGNNLALAQLGARPDLRAVIGNQVVTGIAPLNFANPNLQWEETTSINVALDFGLWFNKLSGTVEWYRKETTDLLLEIPVPQPAPVPTRIENVGETENTGIEFSLDWLALDAPDLSANLGIVFNANSNEVVSLGPRDQIITAGISGRGQSGNFAQIIKPGEPLGSFFGPVFTGIENGAQTFADLDGDGVVEPTGDDRQIIGNAQPDFTYGFRASVNVQNFDISLFLRGEQGRDVFNNTALVFQTKSAVLQGQNFLRDALDDPDAVSEAAKFSDRWIEDGSFLRLDNVTVGYSFDAANLTNQVRSVYVYVSANNLLTITGYSGYDPEVSTNAGLASIGIDYLNYPRPRTFTAGLRLGF